MRNELSNLLLAASILLALTTALFGLFYPAIKSALDIKPKLHAADNKVNYNISKNTIKSQLLPLLVGSIIISAIFIPELIFQINRSFNVVIENGLKNTTYDTLTASFIAVCIFMLSISIVVVMLGYKMKKQIKKLKSK